MNNFRRRVAGKSKQLVGSVYIVQFTKTNNKYYPQSIQTLPFSITQMSLDDANTSSYGTNYKMTSSISNAFTLVNMPYKILKINVYDDGSYTSAQVKSGKANFTYSIYSARMYLYANQNNPPGYGSVDCHIESSTVTGYTIEQYPKLCMSGNFYPDQNYRNNLYLRQEYSVELYDYGDYYIYTRMLDTNSGAFYQDYSKIVKVVADITAHTYTIQARSV